MTRVPVNRARCNEPRGDAFVLSLRRYTASGGKGL